MIRKNIRTCILCLPMLLGGCVIAWGGAYQIESQTENGITVKYDTTFIEESEIQSLAGKHCRNYGRVALLQAHDTSMWGLSTESFVCNAPAKVSP